jgi:Phage integrase, N-terminal SAM-like domain
VNANRDTVFKRCGCTDKKTGRQLAGRCPRLAEPGHGSWYYAVQVTTVGGRKARYRRGGFATRETAVAARRTVLDGPAGQAAAGAWTLARWLRYWLKLAGPHLRPSTLHGYRDHIERYLIPSLGRITLADLTGEAPLPAPGGRAAGLSAGMMAPDSYCACCDGMDELGGDGGADSVVYTGR